jgi:hypothetical protein
VSEGPDLVSRVARLEAQLARSQEELQAISTSRSYRLSVVLAGVAKRLAPRRTPTRPAPLPTETQAPIRVLVVALGIEGDELDDLLTSVLRLSDAGPTRPLFIVTSDRLNRFTAARVDYEYVPPEPDYRREFPEGDYQAFVGQRIATAGQWFRPTAVVVAGAGVLVDHPQIIATALRPGAIAGAGEERPAL